jgi:hypothetical protein
VAAAGHMRVSVCAHIPWESKRAQEKSRRSLMFTEMEVRCSTRPICSAMPMNLRRSGKLSVEVCVFCGRGCPGAHAVEAGAQRSQG